MAPRLAERSIATACILCKTTVELTVSLCFGGLSRSVRALPYLTEASLASRGSIRNVI